MSEFKDKWLVALRSGDYKQGKDYLRRNDEYCCLGVAAEISGDLRMTTTGNGLIFYVLSPEGGQTDTYYKGPNNELDSKGLDSEYTLVGTLIIMNDHDQCTFEQIADYLEDFDF